MTDEADIKPSDRIRAALSGHLPMRDLDDAERTALNDIISERVSRAVTTTPWDFATAPTVVRNVALDEHGHLREYHPDGSVTDLPGPA